MRRQLLLIPVALSLLALSFPVKDQALEIRAQWPNYEENRVVLPPQAAVAGHLGYRELGADVEWARLLVYYGTMIGEHDLIYLTKFIDNVIALDPHFYRVYEWAAQNVTFVHEQANQNEFQLSIDYLHVGIEYFPDSYELHRLLGLRYFLDRRGTPEETKRFKELGAHYMEMSFRKPGAPPDASTLAANLLNRIGQRDHALRILREQILATDYPKARDRMLARYFYLSQSTDLTDELERETLEFEQEWKASVPFAPRSMHVLLGPPPSKVIDFDELATDRNLFGVAPAPADEPPADVQATNGEPSPATQ